MEVLKLPILSSNFLRNMHEAKLMQLITGHSSDNSPPKSKNSLGTIRSLLIVSCVSGELFSADKAFLYAPSIRISSESKKATYSDCGAIS